MLDDGVNLIPAKRLKKSWVEDHKIRSKWKAQKRREGLTHQTSAPVKDTSIDRQDEVDVDSESDTSPIRPDKSPIPSPASSHDKQSLRDLRRIAYASKPLRTQKPDSSPRGNATLKRETGQPNMKLRMNVLLEKIKRDFS